MGYLWIKAFHLISLIAWFAGMFYIWRLFVYHSETDSQEVKNTLSIMEKKLYKIIMTPAMILTVTFGLWMLFLRLDSFLNVYWIWLKILIVCLLIGLHFSADYYRKLLLSGNEFPSRKFRIINEIPTLILFAVVILAVIKPF